MINSHYNDAGKLREELRELFRERCSKGELMRKLAESLCKYPQLKGTPFQEEINTFIVLRAEQDCEVLIQDDEMLEIWG